MIRKNKCLYLGGVKNIVLENSAYVPNGWPLTKDENQHEQVKYTETLFWLRFMLHYVT